MSELSSETPDSSRRLELLVPEMDCPSCAGKIRKSVEALEGIDEIEPRVTSGRLVVDYDPTVATPDEIRERVRAAGYAIEAAGGELTLSVPEMDCPSCAGKVENALAALEGVGGIETRPTSGRVTVSVAADTDSETLVDAVESAGYDATLLSDDGDPLSEKQAVWRSRRAVGTAVGAVLVTAGIALEFVVPGIDPLLGTIAGREYALSHVLFIVAVVVAGTPILRNGYYSARNRSLDIDFLMTVGIVASVAAHHPFEGALLAVLFSVAELLERFSMDRARDSLRELMDLSPDTATVKRDGGEETIPADELVVGDVVVVRPGEKIPADGIVRDGESAVDQSPITGESVPEDKTEGDEVYAGTIAESGYLEVEVESAGDDSTLARIIRMVEDAEREKTEREQFIDRFASVYTPIVVVLAAAAAVVPPLAFGASWSYWFVVGLTLLVISCPCALVISTPVSVVSGITSAARNGVLIKGGRHLEAVGDSDVLAVDKTGTLTEGDLSVTDVIPLEGADEAEVLRRASAAERRSEHPIGQSIVGYADEQGVDADCEVGDFEALTGKGVRAEIDGETHYVGKPDLFDGLADLEHVHVTTDGGVALESLGYETASKCNRPGCLDVVADVVPKLEAEGKTVVIVGSEDGPLGVIAVADRVRPEAEWAVSQLQDQGVRVVMLTGDNEGTARAIANEVGIDEYHAELLPEEKLEWIRRLENTEDDEDGSQDDAHVAMVGDGINDAPALATATVGIAMGAAGTDTALETADVALMGDDLTRLPYLYELSGKANGVIRQNIWSSLAVKAVLAVGAPFGIVTVIHAVVVGDMGMSLGVTGNAMRLANVEPETPEAIAEIER
ncbi:heavy metal translocating P-type ATPase [Natronobacterium gregoryi]|uniref:P-type Cu(+) transporter n=2 Tax=Natronobacterium gregoryi TaxID=44930 RepID=L0AE75_NATGS|nr:heavy metal translocating P-type ATPase [Natronobacterium gregoryi]AFZ71729.1 heavy metal-translocating P-type ATPase, Cd/Co/Hg/Pb/Zn-transporting [Natronobacterium gregoryi SP2]ELY72884.1 ATPase P [Natronobacterium gregoryi SP2]PLK18342.1 cadmium-translocating P-type ATPase [Natronobacterium gregoryi SP2]SFI89141.1 Cd2+/Zn2+-exporting ATPase [Natronobacterium gregoryi]